MDGYWGILKNMGLCLCMYVCMYVWVYSLKLWMLLLWMRTVQMENR